MPEQLFESPRDRATFRKTPMFGGIDLMSARFVRHSFAPHSHDELMIGMIHAGVKSFRKGRTIHHAAPGYVSVINPGEMHTGEREHGPELIYAALYLPKAATAKILTPHDDDCLLVKQPVINDKEIWRYLSAAHKLTMTDDDNAGAEEAMSLGISMLFTRYGNETRARSEASCPKAVKLAMDFLQAHACVSVSLEAASVAFWGKPLPSHQAFPEARRIDALCLSHTNPHCEVTSPLAAANACGPGRIGSGFCRSSELHQALQTTHRCNASALCQINSINH